MRKLEAAVLSDIGSRSDGLLFVLVYSDGLEIHMPTGQVNHVPMADKAAMVTVAKNFCASVTDSPCPCIQTYHKPTGADDQTWLRSLGLEVA
jgi:hypothetical protein